MTIPSGMAETLWRALRQKKEIVRRTSKGKISSAEKRIIVESRIRFQTPEQKYLRDFCKTLRAKLGLTVVQFARQLDVTPRTVRNWEENSGFLPTPNHLVKLLQLYEANE